MPAILKAVDEALKKAYLTFDSIDLIEIQEAFVGQVLADFKKWVSRTKITSVVLQ